MDRFAVELRARIEGDTLVGHAAVFGQLADVGGHWEQLDARAFDKALEGSDARALVNHDPSLLLGRQRAGTLQLRADEHGLAFHVELPRTQAGMDVRELVSRGDLDGGSFGFLPGEDTWEQAPDGRQLRTHTSIRELLDVSVVTFPAYEGAAVQLRSLTITPRSNRSRVIRARHAGRYSKEGTRVH